MLLHAAMEKAKVVIAAVLKLRPCVLLFYFADSREISGSAIGRSRNAKQAAGSSLRGSLGRGR